MPTTKNLKPAAKRKAARDAAAAKAQAAALQDAEDDKALEDGHLQAKAEQSARAAASLARNAKEDDRKAQEAKKQADAINNAIRYAIYNNSSTDACALADFLQGADGKATGVVRVLGNAGSDTACTFYEVKPSFKDAMWSAVFAGASCPAVEMALRYLQITATEGTDFKNQMAAFAKKVADQAMNTSKASDDQVLHGCNAGVMCASELEARKSPQPPASFYVVSVMTQAQWDLCKHGSEALATEEDLKLLNAPFLSTKDSDDGSSSGSGSDSDSEVETIGSFHNNDSGVPATVRATKLAEYKALQDAQQKTAAKPTAVPSLATTQVPRSDKVSKAAALLSVSYKIAKNNRSKTATVNAPGSSASASSSSSSSFAPRSKYTPIAPRVLSAYDASRIPGSSDKGARFKGDVAKGEVEILKAFRFTVDRCLATDNFATLRPIRAKVHDRLTKYHTSSPGALLPRQGEIAPSRKKRRVD